MRRALVLALMALAPVALPAPIALLAAAEPAPAPTHNYPTGKLTIAGEAFAPGDVLDARAIPDINKKVGIMVSLAPAAAARLEKITAALIGRPMLVALDGKTLVAELIHKPVAGGVIEIPGRWTLGEAETLARRISGKDPLPDDLGAE